MPSSSVFHKPIDLHVQCTLIPFQCTSSESSTSATKSIGDEQSFAKNNSAVRAPPGASATARELYQLEFGYTCVTVRHVRAQSFDTRNIMFNRLKLSSGFANKRFLPLRMKLASHEGPVKLAYVPGGGSAHESARSKLEA